MRGFEYLALGKQAEQIGYETLGRAFADVCRETGREANPRTEKTYNIFTVGPFPSDSRLLSLSTRIINRSSFTVPVKLTILAETRRGSGNKDTFFSDIQAAPGTTIPQAVGLNGSEYEWITVRFEIVGSYPGPATRKLYLFAAPRSDPAGYPFQQSHFICQENYLHTDFDKTESDQQAGSPESEENNRPFRASEQTDHAEVP